MGQIEAEFPESGIAIVAGGSGGIGAAVCARLARGGASVLVTYLRNAAGADEAARAVVAAGRRAEVRQLDLGDADAVARVVDDAGPVHTVVHAVGADIPMKRVRDVTPAEWTAKVGAELGGFHHLVAAALPRLRETRGAIVAVTSAGLRRFPSRDVLSTAPKAAIEALVRAIAVEEGRFGVRANSVAPGTIEAGIFLRLKGGDIDEKWLDAARQKTPLKRFGRAEEVAEAVAFLASARAGYITGQSLAVDGGYST